MIGVLIFFTLVLITDIITTIITIIGFKKKFEAMEKVVSGTKVVSDLIGSQIYGAVDTIVSVSEPTRNHYEQYRKLIDENRRQERELAAQHRAEERAFANQFTEAEKESLRLAKQQASNAMDSFVRSSANPDWIETSRIQVVKPTEILLENFGGSGSSTGVCLNR